MSRYHGTEYFAEFDGNQSIDNGKMGRKLFKGGGSGGSSTTENRLDPIVRPYVQYGLEEAQNLYQNYTPEYYPGQTYIDPSTQTQAALQAAQDRAIGGNPLVPAAQQQQLSTIQGGNLGLNPFFNQALQGAGQAATQQYYDAMQGVASQASQAGRYGSGAMQDLQSRASKNLADTLVSKAGELAYTNYANERAAQERAIANAPAMAQADYADIQQLLNVGQTAEDYQREALQSDIDRFEFQQNLPYTQLQSFLSAAYGAPMGSVSTTRSSGGGK